MSNKRRYGPSPYPLVVAGDKLPWDEVRILMIENPPDQRNAELRNKIANSFLPLAIKIANKKTKKYSSSPDSAHRPTMDFDAFFSAAQSGLVEFINDAKITPDCNVNKMRNLVITIMSRSCTDEVVRKEAIARHSGRKLPAPLPLPQSKIGNRKELDIGFGIEDKSTYDPEDFHTNLERLKTAAKTVLVEEQYRVFSIALDGFSQGKTQKEIAEGLGMKNTRTGEVRLSAVIGRARRLFSEYYPELVDALYEAGIPAESLRGQRYF